MERLNNEIVHHPAVMGVHALAVGVKNGLSLIIANQLKIGFLQKMGNIARTPVKKLSRHRTS
jgi:hypothetical protein